MHRIASHARRASPSTWNPAAQVCSSRYLHNYPPDGPDAGDSSPDVSLAREAEALNNELLEFFGVQHTSGPGAAPLAPNISKATNQRRRQDPAASSGSGPAAGIAACSSGAPVSHQPLPRLTHVDASGRASMVDVGSKSATPRSATAAARVLLGEQAFQLVAENRMAKGDVLTVAQLAGIMGAKHTASLIPLCHPLALSHVDVRLQLDHALHAVGVSATAATVGPTGVEMEAMTAAAVAALTVYDMCKACSKEIEVTGLRLLRKAGGKSGDWVRQEEAGGGG